MSGNLDQTDPTFADDLSQSEAHVLRVADWLRGKGKAVAVNPTRIRPDPSEASDYSDGGDLVLLQRLEVKQRRVDFTCAEDYPYPTLIVDVAHAWKRAFPKPFAYIITNREVTHAAIVSGDTAHKWLRVRKMDRYKGRERTFLECPVALCKFVAVE